MDCPHPLAQRHTVCPPSRNPIRETRACGGVNAGKAGKVSPCSTSYVGLDFERSSSRILQVIKFEYRAGGSKPGNLKLCCRPRTWQHRMVFMPQQILGGCIIGLERPAAVCKIRADAPGWDSPAIGYVAAHSSQWPIRLEPISQIVVQRLHQPAACDHDIDSPPGLQLSQSVPIRVPVQAPESGGLQAG